VIVDDEHRRAHGPMVAAFGRPHIAAGTESDV
jgi:hypothetical protein